MKELSIAGKATRYEQAIKVAQRFYNNSVATIKKELEDIFPELKESDDEKIRKSLSAYFSKFKPYDMWDDDFSFGDILAWLEKQCENSMGISETTKQELEDNLNKALEKETLESFNEFLEKQDEQNPTDEIGNYDHKEVIQTIINERKPAWSEEDEKLVKNLISTLSNLYARNLIEKETKEKYTNFLKSLKDRVVPQQQEWSEVDEKMLTTIVDYIISDNVLGSKYIDFLKSLRPQNRWKPSEEQMEYLAKAITTLGNEGDNKTSAILYELRTDLKKLKC